MLKTKEKFLLFRIRFQRDDKAFEALINEHAAALKRFFAFKLPRQEDVEDAFSDTSLRVWNYLTATEVESVSGLIFTIARGVVAEFYRKRKFETVPIEGHDQSSKDDQEKSTAIDMEVEKVKKQIEEIFDEEEQLIFQLRFFDGFSVKEIAKKVQKSENATRVMLHRLLKRLRVALDKKV